MKKGDYVLIYGGGTSPGKRPGTQMARLHSRNRRGDAWRGTKCFSSGRVTTTLRPIDDNDIIASWSYRPTTGEINLVKRNLEPTHV